MSKFKLRRLVSIISEIIYFVLGIARDYFEAPRSFCLNILTLLHSVCFIDSIISTLSNSCIDIIIEYGILFLSNTLILNSAASRTRSVVIISTTFPGLTTLNYKQNDQHLRLILNRVSRIID